MKSDREILKENNVMLRAIINYIVLKEQGRIDSLEDKNDFLQNILANLVSSGVL